MRTAQSWLNLLLMGLLTGLVVYLLLSRPKTAFIATTKVYNEFTFKKELERKLLGVKQAKQKMLDSLEIDLKRIGAGLQQQKTPDVHMLNDFGAKREAYLSQKEKFEEEHAILTEEYDRQILAQLNQYIHDYGTEHRYTYLFGNDGNGSMMYAGDAEDVSVQVIDYVNKRYQGIKE